MRLEKIEILGFKSFADRQIVHVDEHITAVIGPNGCGKSNIVDAVRWAMGEQSAKQLRGGGMADVIFAGCATRGPAGMAEVTLTLATEGGDVPPAYQDYDRIAITRRLYADGTSEYLINKVPARLRDINELLLGTGAGSKGYSIIEQGQVGKLVTSKPEERRHVIDEAAGITRFKAQKAAATRKITATRQNLERVQDVIAELEGRLGSLERAARKAERYQRYHDELRDLDLWTASHDFLELRSLGAVLEARQADLSRQVEDLRRELETQEARREAGRLEQMEVERELSARQEELYGVDNRIQILESEDAYRVRECNAQEGTVQATQAELSVLRESLAELEAELAQARARRDEAAGAEQARAQVERLAEEHEAASARARELATALEQARGELGELATRRATLSAQVRSADEQVADLKARVAEIARTHDGARASLGEQEGAWQELQAATARAQEAADAARKARAELDLRRASARERLQESEVALDAARAELQRCRSRLQSLEEIQGRYRSCASGVQVVIEHQEELAAELGAGASAPGAPAPVMGILADHIRAPKHLEAAVSAMLGERLEGVVVPEPRAAVVGVELLKRVQEGRTTFLPQSCRAPADAEVSASWQDPRSSRPAGIEVVDLSDHAAASAGGSGSTDLPPDVLGRLRDLVRVEGPYGDLVRTLLGDAVVIDGDLARALELWEAGTFAAPLVTLEGDRVEPSGVVVGGSRDALNSALLQQKREIEDLRAVAEQLEAGLAEAKSRHLAVAGELRDLEQARAAADEDIIAAEQALAEARGQATHADQRLAETRERVASLTRERDVLAQQAEQRARTQAEQRAELDAVEAGITTAQARVPELVAEQDAALARLAELGEALTAARVEAARREQEREALAEAAERLGRQVASERERLRRLEETVTRAQARIRELEEASEKAAAERAELVTRSRELTDAVHGVRERHEALRLDLDQLDLSLRNLRGDLEACRGQLQDVQLGVQQNHLQRDHLETDTQERFGVELAEVLIEYHARALAGPKERERQKELKRILSRMGPVNLTAIQEFEEVQARHAYLTGQRDDLTDAIDQLQEAIDQIDRTTRQRFKETFEQVNERFQQVFPRLFNGGRAELRLTDPTNLLETGVEIHAQPPGKQLRSLELLSGGEKALTATSLIFAVFLIKPSPFCILDEVDAPLDDANVVRFCSLVRKLSERTQFIIITHNKISMETADRLYGVTMEQRGISKLVSVNMRRAVEMAYN